MSDDGWGEDDAGSGEKGFSCNNFDAARFNVDLMLMARQASVAEDLKKFYLSKEMSDVQIKCGDQTFDCHKVILSARSPVFNRMLLSEMKEKASGVVDLTDTRPEVVKELLKFIYTGTCYIDADEEPEPGLEIVCELLEAADKYELEHLKKMCEYTLSSSLTAENSIQVCRSILN